MNLQDLTVFRMMSDQMAWLSQRQRVLAENVANADTPNYNARDLKPVKFDKVLRQQDLKLTLATTDEAHIASDGRPGDVGKETDVRAPYEISPTRNGVVLEEQLVKVNANTGQYQLMTGLYRKQLGMFRIALGRSQG